MKRQIHSYFKPQWCRFRVAVFYTHRLSWIVLAHAKDIVGKDAHFAETMPGRGGMDYGAYLRNITSLPQEVPLLLEHLRTPEEYDEARQYVINQAAKAQIQLA